MSRQYSLFVIAIAAAVFCLHSGSIAQVDGDIDSTHGSGSPELSGAQQLVTSYFGVDTAGIDNKRSFGGSVSRAFLNVENHPFFYDSDTTETWLIKTGRLNMKKLLANEALENMPERKFSLYFDRTAGRLLEVCSDSLLNSLPPTRAFDRRQDSSLLQILHRSGGTGSEGLVVCDSVPHATFLDALRHAPELLFAQFIVGYLVKTSNPLEGTSPIRWVIVGYGAPPIKDDQSVYWYTFDGESGNLISQVYTSPTDY